MTLLHPQAEAHAPARAREVRQFIEVDGRTLDLGPVARRPVPMRWSRQEFFEHAGDYHDGAPD